MLHNASNHRFVLCGLANYLLLVWLTQPPQKTESKFDMSRFPLERTRWIFFSGEDADAVTSWIITECVYKCLHALRETCILISLNTYWSWFLMTASSVWDVFCFFFLQHKAHQLVKGREKWDHWGFVACLAVWYGNSYVADMQYRSSGAENINWN